MVACLGLQRYHFIYNGSGISKSKPKIDTFSLKVFDAIIYEILDSEQLDQWFFPAIIEARILALNSGNSSGDPTFLLVLRYSSLKLNQYFGRLC